MSSEKCHSGFKLDSAALKNNEEAMIMCLIQESQQMNLYILRIDFSIAILYFK